MSSTRRLDAPDCRVCDRCRGASRDNPFPEASPIRAPAFFFNVGEVVATAGYPGEQEFRVYFDRVAYMRLFPRYADQPPVGLAKIVRVFEARNPCPMSMVIGGIPARNRFGPIIHDPIGESELWALTQGFDTGELWGLNGQIFRPHAHEDFIARKKEPITFIPMIIFERIYCRVLRNYVQVASAELQLRQPYTIELGATGLDGVFLAVPGGRPFRKGRDRRANHEDHPTQAIRPHSDDGGSDQCCSAGILLRCL